MVTGNAEGAERGEQPWVAQSVWHHHVGAHRVPCSVLYPRAQSQGYRDGLRVSGAVSGALLLPPGTRWAPCDPPACPPGSLAAWHKPGQLHIPGARFSSTGGIRGSSRGLSPPGSLRRARLGDHGCGNLLQALQGTRGKHNSDAAAVQLLPVGCGGCVPEGPSSAVPRCQLCLCGAEPF